MQGQELPLASLILCLECHSLLLLIILDAEDRAYKNGAYCFYTWFLFLSMRCVQVAEGLNDTAEAFLASIDNNDSEVAPSSIYAAACILEGVPFINGSPQNTFVPGLIELAVEKGDLSPT